ncbi:hypothetical protein PaG_00227 [Moesziomyces aphidis]|uniref:Helicase SWR1 n=1 Tax=Moesziomyces aphidis TaxID=84754 RepID=W3VUI1_MOEAP|nr:hypothetical protein PaG_00227 [Moesziomyces aphidis]
MFPKQHPLFPSASDPFPPTTSSFLSRDHSSERLHFPLCGPSHLHGTAADRLIHHRSHRASVRAHNNKVGSPPSLADSAPSRRVRGVAQHTSVGADHAAEAEELLLRASGAAASASRQNGPTFMSTGGTHSHHAETSSSNLSGSHHSGAENGHDAPAAGTNGDASHAETSRQGSTSGERSVSPRNEATPAAPVKRKRLAAELAFSSPGPAFQLQKDAEADEQLTSDTPGRARRPRRSTTLNGGGTSSLTSNRRASQSRPQQVSASLRDEEPFDAKPRLTPTISPKPYANEADLDAPNETTRIGTEAGPIASTSSSRSDRSRSRSRSAFQQDESETQSFSDQGQAESPAKPPLPLRTRPQITPIAAHDAATPLPQILERRRHEKVAVAQSDLEEVHDRHDMLVRELFHLTKFVTMVGYDPDEARNDQSDVFTTFKHAHDLRFSLDDAGSGAEASGSGRVTRRRVNARLESLSLKRPPPPTSPATRATSAKNGSKRRSSDRFPGRASSSTAEPEARGSTADASEGATSDDNSQDEDDISDMSDSQAASRRAGKQKSSRGRSKGKQKQSRTTAPSRKRQSSFADDSFDTPAKRSSGARKSKALDELDAFILRHQPRPLPEQAPPLHILAPHQVPALKRFGGDINALWTSFDLLRDGEGGRDPAEVEAEDLQTYLRRDQRWRAGLPIHPESGGIARHVPAKAARTTKSHHDHLLDAVAASYQPMRQYAKSRQQNARRVARMVAQHWERQLGSSEREKKAEEKRIRALAKWTLREVLKQWRLAVNVVRARKAAAEKAEKEKLDKEQLNAILEQSTAMLKKQHQVMTTNADGFSDSDMDGNSDRTSYGSDDSTEAAESEDEASDADPDADVDEGIDARDGSEPATVEALPATIAEVDAIDDATSATGASTPAAAETQPSPVHAPASSRPQRSSRRTRGAARPTAAQQARAAAKLEADDVEFAVAEADDAEEEDAELERQMWEEDEEDDSEDAGLAADANIPIEELLKRYGYGASPEEAESEDNDNQADAGASTANQSDREPDEQMPDVEDVKGEEATDDDKDTEASDEETPTREDRSASLALLRQADESADELSDAESVATGGRRGSRRSMTRASSIVSSDRAVTRSRQPFLLRGQLRPYQQIGFEWLASLYANGMGLGKTIQTISLLAHLACDKGVWGPHLVVAPTSVMLNWEVEFKKFLPGFKILSYYGNQKERKEKRIGWNTENSFNVCITSYQLVLADQHIFRRKPWVYLVLDEAHHIKNFRSQRWQTLLGFNSQRRLLLTGTPLQNNLMDLWSLMYFLMPHGVSELPGGGAFANMKDFQDWFSNPLDKAIEGGNSMSDETRAMVQKLHAVLRPYLLRRLKSEVEKELPSKYEHVITCRLSKRQRFLYNDFMSRAKTRESLASGNYLSIINCLMQLRKVCNHPDLFEVRPIVTSFAMSRSVVADFEIKDLLVRRELLREDVWDKVDLDATNFRFTDREEHLTAIESRDLRRLNAAKKLPYFGDAVAELPELETWTIDGFAKSREQRRLVGEMERWKHAAYINQYRCTKRPVYGAALIRMLREAGRSARLEPAEQHEGDRRGYLDRCDNLLRMVQSRSTRRENMQPVIDRFAFVTPRAVAVDMPRWALAGFEPYQQPEMVKPEFDTVHPVAVKLHIAFPDASLLQYDCGKLQQLDLLMRRLKDGGHRILIFTQMTRVLDILESFLNYHGYRYLRLDGATKVEQRQALTEKFNRDLRISAFILSTRSGGLGINLTGADTVLFYDLDWNAAIEAQCMDRAHRIGQTRDVHIYRFVTEHTIEENMLRKANQKRLLDSVVIQQGEFNTETLAKRIDWRDMLDDGGRLGDVEVKVDESGETGREVERAFLDAEDEEDRQAALAARQEMVDEDEFDEPQVPVQADAEAGPVIPPEEDEEEGGTVDDYMLGFVEREWDFFA